MCSSLPRCAARKLASRKTQTPLAATRFDNGTEGAPDPIDRVSSKPSFQALVYPATEEHLERVSNLIQRGVRILTVDHDYSAMRRFYTNALGRLRPIAEKQV